METEYIFESNVPNDTLDIYANPMFASKNKNRKYK